MNLLLAEDLYEISSLICFLKAVGKFEKLPSASNCGGKF